MAMTQGEYNMKIRYSLSILWYLHAIYDVVISHECMDKEGMGSVDSNEKK